MTVTAQLSITWDVVCGRVVVCRVEWWVELEYSTVGLGRERDVGWVAAGWLLCRSLLSTVAAQYTEIYVDSNSSRVSELAECRKIQLVDERAELTQLYCSCMQSMAVRMAAELS